MLGGGDVHLSMKSLRRGAEQLNERFQDQDPLDPKLELLQRINILKQCKLLVFIQTKDCLSHPAILLELFIALVHNIPLCPVFVDGSGYSFSEAQVQLRQCNVRARECYPKLYRIAESIALREGYNMRQLMWTLLGRIPTLISVKYLPGCSHMRLSATVHDILERMQTLRRETSKEGQPLLTPLNVSPLLARRSTPDDAMRSSTERHPPLTRHAQWNWRCALL